MKKIDGNKLNAYEMSLAKPKMTKCPDCKGKFDAGWAETGPNPSTKVYCRKCSKCLSLINSHSIITQAIEDNLKKLSFLKSCNASFESVELIEKVINKNCDYQPHYHLHQEIVSLLIHYDLY